jgi:gluconolactonase
LSLSIDGSRLYVTSPTGGQIRTYEVTPNDLENARDLTGMPAGTLAVKEGRDHRLYACGTDGIHVFAQDGTDIDHIDHLVVPSPVSGIAWGGVDGATLFITASNSLFRCRMPALAR